MRIPRLSTSFKTDPRKLHSAFERHLKRKILIIW